MSHPVLVGPRAVEVLRRYGKLERRAFAANMLAVLADPKSSGSPSESKVYPTGTWSHTCVVEDLIVYYRWGDEAERERAEECLRIEAALPHEADEPPFAGTCTIEIIDVRQYVRL